MANSKTETARDLGFLLSEGNGHISRETVTIATAAGKLEAGTVLGKITASSKYVASPDTGADGSQVATAVLAYNVDATGGDVKAVIVARDAEVKKDDLAYAASVNDGAKKTAKATQLAAVGIFVR